MSGATFSWTLIEGSPPPTPTSAPLLPRLVDIVDAGKAAITTARPSTAQWLDEGRYAEVIAGWRYQAQYALRRLANECASARIPLAKSQALLELIASYFDVTIDGSAKAAVGTVMLTRPAYSGQTSGLIRAGSKLRKPGDNTVNPPVKSASYEVAEPVYVNNDYSIVQTVPVKIRATQAGSASNLRPYDPALVLSDALFDTHFTIASADAAGGSEGASDAKLRSLAMALATGQDGPTLQAIHSGLLLTDGVAHVAVSEPGDGTVLAWLCDESWCYSTELAFRAMQVLKDNYLGFGCKVIIAPVVDKLVAVTATVQLRDKRDAAYLEELGDLARTALRSYFDDRGDWYTWKANGIAAAIARADRRLLKATNIVVKDSAGVTLAAPSTALPTTATSIYHYQLDDANVALNFIAPS